MDRRLRWLLKRTLRYSGFRAVSVVSAPQAWVGWVLDRERGWIRVSTGISPAAVLSLLELRALNGETLLVLPAGVTPP